MPAHRPTHQSTFQPTWTVERIELLKIHFQAGLSCREIAAEIGVSRNAVIGKLSRLNLTRDKAGNEPLVPKSTPKRQRREPVPKLRYQLLKALRAESLPAKKDEPIHNGHSCSLLELSNERCRWPINTPGADDFCFCGNPPIEGMPYCSGHSRLAYRVSAR
ncbi:MAG TPA: GcrA family cell cycle regulator [Bradyrhizobium sp.]